MKHVGLVLKNSNQKSAQTVPAQAKPESKSKRKSESESEAKAVNENGIR